MKSILIRTAIALAIAAPALVMLGVSGASAVARADENAPSLKVGVIDLGAVFKGYDRAADLEKEINDEKDRLDSEQRELRSEAQKIRRELELAEPDSDEYETLSARLAALLGRLEHAKKRRDERLKERLEEYNGLVRADIKVAITEYGEAHGYNLILARQSGDAGNEPFFGATGVLFAKGVEDVTAGVTALLNEKYAKRPKTPEPH